MTVKYLHVRMVDSEGYIQPKGGVTVAYTCSQDEIMLAVALCHDNDLFCYRVGREIASGRLKSPNHETQVIALTHPKTHCIIDWLALEWFVAPVNIYQDEKHRWVSTFEPEDGEISFMTDEDWEKQIELQTQIPTFDEIHPERYSA